MSPKLTDDQQLEALIDALGESVADAPEEEILEEAKLSGIDVKVEAARLKAMMLSTVREHEQKQLRTAREGYTKEAARIQAGVYRLPKTPEKLRALFSFVLARQPQYAELFTAQHREFKDLTDADIEGYLRDLAELGVLEKIESDEHNANK
jgi:hypothetical protein